MNVTAKIIKIQYDNPELDKSVPNNPLMKVLVVFIEIGIFVNTDGEVQLEVEPQPNGHIVCVALSRKHKPLLI